MIVVKSNKKDLTTFLVCGYNRIGIGIGFKIRVLRVRISLPALIFGAIAQLGERLPCTQKVEGSNPSGSTNRTFIWEYSSVG